MNDQTAQILAICVLPLLAVLIAFAYAGAAGALSRFHDHDGKHTLARVSQLLQARGATISRSERGATKAELAGRACEIEWLPRRLGLHTWQPGVSFRRGSPRPPVDEYITGSVEEIADEVWGRLRDGQSLHSQDRREGAHSARVSDADHQV
jgi:hypothetical protein